MKLDKIAKRFRIDKPDKFKIADYDPAECFGLSIDKDDAKDLLKTSIERLSDLQERLYANNKWSVLLVFQAMDAAGKDGAIKHVMSGVNPQGVQVHSFKAPSEEELDHDFLWRIAKALPERGRIGIFNRSHYEDVLIVRVHKLVPKQVWRARYEAINGFERHLAAHRFGIQVDRVRGVPDFRDEVEVLEDASEQRQ